ncbi:MAG: hypothetical protein PHW04_10415 [Candidatus Wallbacteria bacterium]|nr:hypothetical protein [Candidatus Wallbacteria bacterium]
MIYFLRIFCWRRSGLWTVLLFTVTLTVLFVFNIFRGNLHGVFWNRLLSVYPEYYLIPEREAILPEQWEVALKNAAPPAGVEFFPVASSPAVIESGGKALGVMLDTYLDLPAKLRRNPGIYKLERKPGEGMIPGVNLKRELALSGSCEARIFLLNESADFDCSGFVDTGYYDYDSYHVLLGLEGLSRLKEIPCINEIEIYGSSELVRQAAGKFEGFRLQSFWERNPELAKAKSTENLFFRLFLAVYYFTVFLVVLNIYQLRLSKISRDILITRVMGIGRLRLFTVLFADLALNSHLGLLGAMTLLAFIFKVFPSYPLPQGVYGIDSIDFKLSLAIDKSGYSLILLFIFLLSTAIFTIIMKNDIIKELR